jgi:hypothetical protein
MGGGGDFVALLWRQDMAPIGKDEQARLAIATNSVLCLKQYQAQTAVAQVVSIHAVGQDAAPTRRLWRPAPEKACPEGSRACFARLDRSGLRAANLALQS